MKKILRNKICLVFSGIVLLILIFFSQITEAEQEIKLFVSPEMFEWQVKRGEYFPEKLRIYNKSDVPVPIEVTVTNFGAQEESGTITFFDEPFLREGQDDISYNPRKWVKIEKPNFILDSAEREEINIEVSVPEDAEPGGHYVVILFEPKLPSFYFEEQSLRAISKIGVLLLFSVQVEGVTRPSEPLTIVEFNIPEEIHLRGLENFLAQATGVFDKVQAAEESTFSIIESSHFPFTLRIKNNDIYHWKPEGRLTILRTNGKIVGQTEIKKTTILPGRTRKFPVEFKTEIPESIRKYLPAFISDFISKNFLFGKYKAHLSLIQGNDTIKDTIEFWVFPWRVLLLTGLTIALGMIFLIKYRKRIRSAIVVLFRK